MNCILSLSLRREREDLAAAFPIYHVVPIPTALNRATSPFARERLGVIALRRLPNSLFMSRALTVALTSRLHSFEEPAVKVTQGFVIVTFLTPLV